MEKNGTYLRILTSWLSPVVQSSNSIWYRCWRASVDGWAASTFHSRCDGKGPTVTIIKVGRYIFGGYTSVSWGKWASYASRRRTINVMLFHHATLTIVKSIEQYFFRILAFFRSFLARNFAISCRCLETRLRLYFGAIYHRIERLLLASSNFCQWQLIMKNTSAD